MISETQQIAWNMTLVQPRPATDVPGRAFAVDSVRLLMADAAVTALVCCQVIASKFRTNPRIERHTERGYPADSGVFMQQIKTIVANAKAVDMIIIQGEYELDLSWNARYTMFSGSALPPEGTSAIWVMLVEQDHESWFSELAQIPK